MLETHNGGEILINLIKRRHSKRHPASTLTSKLIIRYLIPDLDERVSQSKPGGGLGPLTEDRRIRINHLMRLDVLPAYRSYSRAIKVGTDHPLVYPWAKILIIVAQLHPNEVLDSGIITELQRISTGLKHDNDVWRQMFERNLEQLSKLQRQENPPQPDPDP